MANKHPWKKTGTKRYETTIAGRWFSAEYSPASHAGMGVRFAWILRAQGPLNPRDVSFPRELTSLAKAKDAAAAYAERNPLAEREGA